ncbi:MAG: fatty acid desaturase [Pseudomonadota bacterium]|nr:fatty acid desaturase [Pseudomonadota bacterium]
MYVAGPTLRALCVEAAVAWGTLALVVGVWHPLLTVVGIVIIATRQHALFILYHDAVHGLIARPRRLNDLLINVFVGLPQLLPIHIYRSLHLVHHQHLGTERDPERLLLYAGQPWAYQPLPAGALARQLLGDLFLWNNVATGLRYARERLAPNPRLRLPAVVVYPEFFLLAAIFYGVGAALAWQAPDLALRVAIAWFLPLVTLTQAIQKVRSFAEHGAEGVSYSWAPGLFGRLVLWPYNIHYHREHHARADVPWFELPATFPDRDARPGSALGALLLARSSPG